MIPSIKKNAPDLDYGVATVPGFKDRGTVLGGWNTVISAKTKHPKEAWQFVKFFTSPEHIAIFTSTFPPRRSVAACGRFQDPIQQVGVEALEYARPAPTTPLWPAMQEVLHKAIQQALLSQKSVRESLDWAAEQIDDIIKRG